jgi:hypothetical protein
MRTFSRTNELSFCSIFHKHSDPHYPVDLIAVSTGVASVLQVLSRIFRTLREAAPGAAAAEAAIGHGCGLRLALLIKVACSDTEADSVASATLRIKVAGELRATSVKLDG